MLVVAKAQQAKSVATRQPEISQPQGGWLIIE
jgi:hypothetical protein